MTPMRLHGVKTKTIVLNLMWDSSYCKYLRVFWYFTCFQVWIYLLVEHSECEGVWPQKKLSQEMGPHYISCILSPHNNGGKIISVLKHHTVEMCMESVDKVPHICMHITGCMWVMSSMYKSHGHISGSLNWRLSKCYGGTGSTREKSYTFLEPNPLLLAHKQLFWWTLEVMNFCDRYGRQDSSYAVFKSVLVDI
jgi:hypothetical protein